jgi:phage repressor protein C with HTH and peptisase S24 domain
MTQKVSSSTKGEMLNVIKRHLNMNKNSEFARFLGISSQAVSNWYSRNTFDAELLYTKCDFINPDWLLTGRGSMLKSEEVSLMGGKETGKEEALPEVNYEYKGAPYYNVDFIGGFDLVLNDQTRNPDYYINFAPYNKEGVIWCNITGHSMEPELNNGDFIAMKEMHSPIQYLPAGEIYGIITEDYRTVKRIRMADQKGFVRLIPTNKSPEYAEQEIPVEMIRKVYAVLGSMHRLF